MDDLRVADVDFLTLGQYLQPTVKHAAVDRFVTPEEFGEYAAMARSKGFLMVSATPLTRSSYHADADFAQLRDARARLLAFKHSADPRRDADAAVYARPDVLSWWRMWGSIRSSCRGAWALACGPRTPTELVADLTIGFGPFRESFHEPGGAGAAPHRCTVKYENGPFRYLNNQWSFEPDPVGCRVSFFVEFEFKSKLLQAAIGVVFNEAVRRMVNAFLKRAQDVYGVPSRAPAAVPAQP